MLAAAAVLPHPPLLIPEVASGAAAELDAVRAGCTEAMKELAAADPDVLIVVGSGPVGCDFGDSVQGSLRRFGVEREIGWPAVAEGSAVDLPLPPLSLLVAAWLLSDGQWATPVQFHSVSPQTSLAEARALGGSLASADTRVAFAVMGDGSAALSVKAPGYLVPGATQWHARAREAIGSADHQAISEFTDMQARQFVVAGLVPWWVLAGAAAGDRWVGELLADAAPYGVGYLVATWRRHVGQPRGGR